MNVIHLELGIIRTTMRASDTHSRDEDEKAYVDAPPSDYRSGDELVGGRGGSGWHEAHGCCEGILYITSLFDMFECSIK